MSLCHACRCAGGETLKHFKAEGSLFRSVGIAGKGTSKRKVLLLGMGFFGFVFMSIVVFLLRSAGLGSIVFVMVPIFVLSFGFSIMVIGRTMGKGRMPGRTAVHGVPGSFRRGSALVCCLWFLPVNRVGSREAALSDRPCRVEVTTTRRIRFRFLCRAVSA